MNSSQLNTRRRPNVIMAPTQCRQKDIDALSMLERCHMYIQSRRYSKERFVKTFNRF